MQQKCCSSWPLLQQEQVGPDLHDVWKQHQQISQSLKVLVSQLSPTKLNMAQERGVKASKWSVWNVCCVFHGLSAALWALQSSHKSKKQQQKREETKNHRPSWRQSSEGWEQQPAKGAPEQLQITKNGVWRSKLAFAGCSGWGHKVCREEGKQIPGSVPMQITKGTRGRKPQSSAVNTGIRRGGRWTSQTK